MKNKCKCGKSNPSKPFCFCCGEKLEEPHPLIDLLIHCETCYKSISASVKTYQNRECGWPYNLEYPKGADKNHPAFVEYCEKKATEKFLIAHKWKRWIKVLKPLVEKL
jgi:hypothetical protein